MKLFVFVIFINCLVLHSQNAIFEKAFNKTIHSAVESWDSGYILVGRTERPHKQLTVIKLTRKGVVLWCKKYGEIAKTPSDSTQFSWGSLIKRTRDKKYIVAGCKYGWYTMGNIWLLKIDEKGDIIWEKTFDKGLHENVEAIQENEDRFLIAGTRELLNYGSVVWLIKVCQNGETIWEKTLKKRKHEIPTSIVNCDNGNIIVTQYTHKKKTNARVTKIDQSGNIIWKKSFGGKANDTLLSILESKKNEFIIVGYTESYSAGSLDAWIIKIDQNGNKIWEKIYGGKKMDEANFAWKTSKEEIFIIGSTQSFGKGNYNIWLLNIDNNGNKITEKVYNRQRRPCFFEANKYQDFITLIPIYTNKTLLVKYGRKNLRACYKIKIY